MGGQYKIFRKGFGIPGTEVNFTGIAYDDVWTKLEHFFNPTDLLRFDFGAKGYRIMIEQFIGLFIIYVIIQCFLVFFWEPLAKKKNFVFLEIFSKDETNSSASYAHTESSFDYMEHQNKDYKKTMRNFMHYRYRFYDKSFLYDEDTGFMNKKYQ